jgi:isochorismate pyruvate lyase
MSSSEPRVDTGPVRRFRDPAYVPRCATLAEVRANIDRIDRQIVALLAERGAYVKDAARFKADSDQVAAPQRQAEVFARVRALATELGAYPEVVEAAYRALVAGFVAREQTDFADMEPIR